MPNTPPKFFVPDIPEGVEESAWYHDLASLAQQAVPPENERVFSITYTHNGEQWTSTVGETSRGMLRRSKGRGAAKREVVERLSDAATVLAIFPGNPYYVVTDNNIVRQVRSEWANPFMMGSESISSIVLFSR